MTMIRDAWYVAALPEKIREVPLGRTILDIPVALFRGTTGAVSALVDVCPHRFAALSNGILKEGRLQCPYHGLEFDGDGRCVLNPHGNGATPSALNVRALPVVERDDLIWIWPGEAALADPNDIPDFGCRIDPRFRTVGGVGHVDCNYRLLVDNLMDLGHAQYVHRSNAAAEAFNRAERKVVTENGEVSALLKLPDGPPTAIMSNWLGGYNGLVDMWNDIRWSKVCAMLNFVGVAPAGSSREDSVGSHGTHILTPETETSCHYFYGHSRNFSQDDPEMDEQARAWQRLALNVEDKVIVEAIEARRGYVERHGIRPAMLACDKAAVLVSKEIDRLEQRASARADQCRQGRV